MFKEHKRSYQFLKSLILKHTVWCYIFVLDIAVTSFLSLLLPYIAKLELDQLVDQSEQFLIFSETPLGIFVIIIAIAFAVDMINKIFTWWVAYYKRIHERMFEDDYFISLYKKLKYIELWVYANKKEPAPFRIYFVQDGTYQMNTESILRLS